MNQQWRALGHSSQCTHRTKLHPVVPPPLKLVRMLLSWSTHSARLPFRYYLCRYAMFVHHSWHQKYNIQTDARALSWYKLVTYVCVGCCVIYTSCGPLALGCVNHTVSYTSVCNLYIQTLIVIRKTVCLVFPLGE